MLKQIDTDVVRKSLTGKDSNMRTYLKLMAWAQSCDVTQDYEFQTRYRGFYRVRRNNDWSQPYFEYMERNKATHSIFGDVLIHMFEKTGMIEGSFSSKLLATINSDSPIWDEIVLRQLSIKQPIKGQKDKQKQLKESLATFSELEQWYANYIKSSNASEIINIFDTFFPYAADISNIKKIDWALWSMGSR